MVGGVAAASGTTGAALLDLHEGIVSPAGQDPRQDGREWATRCARWPEGLYLKSSDGELVEGRCHATNKCRYCQQLYVLETLEMLWLDAAEYAPEIWVVLTAREHLTRADCRRHLEHLRKAARRLWPAIEWFVQVEFQRRGALHLNLLVKGVAASEREQLHELLVRVWCDRVDALPAGQWSDTVEDAGGVTRYLQKTLAHGLKQEQAPPIGWRGHRTSQTRGYLVQPAAAMREEARASLRLKRAIWRAEQAGCQPGEEAELVAQAELQAAEGVTWSLHKTSRVVSVGTVAVTRGEPARRYLANQWRIELARWRTELEAGVTHPPSEPFRQVGLTDSR